MQKTPNGGEAVLILRSLVRRSFMSDGWNSRAKLNSAGMALSEDRAVLHKGSSRSLLKRNFAEAQTARFWGCCQMITAKQLNHCITETLASWGTSA